MVGRINDRRIRGRDTARSDIDRNLAAHLIAPQAGGLERKGWGGARGWKGGEEEGIYRKRIWEATVYDGIYHTPGDDIVGFRFVSSGVVYHGGMVYTVPPVIKWIAVRDFNPIHHLRVVNCRGDYIRHSTLLANILYYNGDQAAPCTVHTTVYHLSTHTS